MTGLQLFTIFHTALSIVAIIAGIMVVKGMIGSAGRQLWTLLFLVTAAFTTITGFMFPFNGITPAFILGIISLVPITLAFLGRYRRGLTGKWLGIYVISAVVTLYFNCFVLVVQAFRHVEGLKKLAPTQTEPPFQFAQLDVLILFIVLGIFSYRRYHPKKLQEELAAEYISPHPEPEAE